jgi:hypothetical protein
LQARETALNKAIESENIDAIMRFYSVTWTNANGATLADLRADLEESLPLIDFVDAQGSTSYLVSDDNTEVASGGGGTIRFRVEETGEIVTVAVSGGSVWRKMGENWFVVYSQADAAIQQALRRRR